MLSVSVAILSYNEAKSLPTIVERLMETVGALPYVDFRPVVVNNGSHDDTPSVVAQLQKRFPQLTVVTIDHNQGYGYGVRTGLAALSGDIVGYMWGDNQFDAKIVSDMVQLFQDHPEYQFVKTYRAKRYDGNWRLVISRVYQILFRLLYNAHTRDINSGPKLFRRELIESIGSLHSNDWFVDAEIMIKATRHVAPQQMIEIPMTFFPRPHGKSNVRFSTCIEFVYNLFKYRFSKHKS